MTWNSLQKVTEDSVKAPVVFLQLQIGKIAANFVLGKCRALWGEPERVHSIHAWLQRQDLIDCDH